MSADSIWTERHEVDAQSDEFIRFDIPMPDLLKGINPDGIYDFINVLPLVNTPITDILFFHRGPNCGIDTSRACILKSS